MTEITQNNNGYQSENLVARLYFFREASREFLERDNAVVLETNQLPDETLLTRIFSRFSYLVEDLAPEVSDKVLADVVKPVTELLIETGQRDFGTQSWFQNNVSAEARAQMMEAIKEGQKFAAQKEKLEQKLSMVGVDNHAATTVVDESEEAKLFKSEIRCIIQKSRKYSDAEKTAMLAALAQTGEIAYKIKSAKIVYRFGEFEVVGTVANNNMDIRNAQGVRIYSSGEQFDKDFVKKLKTSGKIKTGLGLSAQNAKNMTKKADKKTVDLQQQIVEIEKKIAQNQNKQQQCFEGLIRSLSPHFLLADMANPKGIIAHTAEKADKTKQWVAVRDKLITAIFSNKLVWSAYLEKKNTSLNNKQSRFTDEVEKVLNRHDERQRLIAAGRNFFATFQKLATNEAKQFDVARVDDEMLKKLLQHSVSMLNADLPLGVRKEVIRQEIFRQALQRDGFVGFDEQKFQMMNRVLALEGMKIQLVEKQIGSKLETDSARSFSTAILQNMRQSDLITDKHKMEAFLYRLGAYCIQNPKGNLKEVTHDVPYIEIFHQFADACYHKNTRYSIISPQMKSRWERFVSDAHNLKQAKTMYALLHKTQIPGIKVEQLVAHLAQGQGVNDNGLVQQSKHHLLYRRFAGFYGHDLNELNNLFNAKEHIIDTISLHPALKDMHRDVEHRFDMGEEYLYRRENGQVVFGAYSSGQSGDVLLVPVVCVKNEKGVFEPLMKENMLLMTSSGVVMEPHIPDREENSQALSQQQTTTRV